MTEELLFKILETSSSLDQFQSIDTKTASEEFVPIKDLMIRAGNFAQQKRLAKPSMKILACGPPPFLTFANRMGHFNLPRKSGKI